MARNNDKLLHDVWKRAIAGETQHQIAARLRVTARTVDNLLRQARQKFSDEARVDRKELRRLHHERYEALFSQLWKDFYRRGTTPLMRAKLSVEIDRCLTAQRKLWGVDAPQRVDLRAEIEVRSKQRQALLSDDDTRAIILALAERNGDTGVLPCGARPDRESRHMANGHAPGADQPAANGRSR